MFDLPDAKRVRREELHASDESSWSESEVDAELEARLNAQIAKSLGIDESAYRPPQPPTTLPVLQRPQASGKRGREALSSDSESEPGIPVDDDSTPIDEGGEAEDEGYAFRLFSTAGPAPKVVLEDYDKVVEGKLLRGRPLSYYMATEVSPQKKREYEVAAVSGEDVLARSKVRHWGLELPWKVTSIKITRKARPGEIASHARSESEQQAGRKRPGKKSRIAMRKKARAQAQAEEEAKKKMASKEEQIKEKKKRLNRLKKLRRRAQKKAEKGENGEGGGGSGEGSSDEE
ncbi:hypothetical protein HDV57DRAFT_484431 [Trichoderma longibrachiatum]|uniref:Uncharacterized protein n=1 Tax=Trichoderma longibrachiatum ATCC 18648 TaxID=983965 RepID=A0A2T4CDT8_TRILO|nr:hypothetical protein M440DRAFT_1350674 [Trichoderma longibrachiatum ATCC 18648]